MFPLSILVMMLCLQCEGLCSAVHTVQMVNLQVEYGESTILPCNGSAYLEEETSVQWEAMGEDVAILWGWELRQGDKFKFSFNCSSDRLFRDRSIHVMQRRHIDGVYFTLNSLLGRVQLSSEEKLKEGDWSVALQHTMLSDTDMYECIWQGRKTISTVWLTVTAPHVERSLVVPAGDMVDLACYIQMSRGQSPNDLQVWWTKNGSTIVSTEKQDLFSTAVVSNSEDISRIHLLVDTKEAFHLHMSPVMKSDSGEYRCLYKIRDSDDPRPGIPESITLTVLETNPSNIVMTESQPMEAVEETVASFPDDETPETESAQWDTLPWIRIGLIGGVLLVTVVVLCILGALRKI